MLPCAICNAPLHLPWSCQQTHPDQCCDCHRLNLAASYDSREHLAPETPLVLSARDVAALVRYRQHVQRAQGTGPLTDLVTGEDT